MLMAAAHDILSKKTLRMHKLSYIPIEYRIIEKVIATEMGSVLFFKLKITKEGGQLPSSFVR